MSRAYADLAFTPTVRATQTQMGSRQLYAPLDQTEDRRDALGAAEADFIAACDGFYQATVSESGWPYVQFRGGPAGFLRVLDERTVAYADFRGNRQYISTGNLRGNDRVSIILMDYARQRRLKLLGRLSVTDWVAHDPQATQLLEPGYRARPQRVMTIKVEGFDWNCPQHIPVRIDAEDVQRALNERDARIKALEAQLAAQPRPAPD
ncbi:MAG: pyridoxamine 5'-phosphate oxidase [Burkholderiales bacterium PBB5]|nr:MAG: pyridoxamine 5'-phosphate oxidase [Burkholderiales bacterium PBB5]